MGVGLGPQFYRWWWGRLPEVATFEQRPAGVKEGAMQTSGRRAFQKEGRRNKRAKGKGASQLKEHKEVSVAETEPGRGQWCKLSPVQ